MSVDKERLLMLSLTELDKAGSLCAQLWRNADSSREPLLQSALESLSKAQTLLVALLTSEHETRQGGLVSEDTPE